MKINLNADTAKAIGKGTWKVTKVIAKEGSKALLEKYAMTAIGTIYNGGGIKKVKDITLDDVIEGKNVQQTMFENLFGSLKKKDKKVDKEVVIEIVDAK